MQKYSDDGVFLSPLVNSSKIILSKHFLSVSPVLISFSTHFLEEFEAAEFILIIQSVRLSYNFEDLVSILTLLGDLVL